VGAGQAAHRPIRERLDQFTVSRQAIQDIHKRGHGSPFLA